MSLGEVFGPLAAWSAGGARSGTALLVRVRRSAPRPPGARFAANERGDVAGSVSSGCVESDLAERILAAVSGSGSELVRYGISDEMAAGVGLSCGGEIEVLVAPHDPADAAWLEAGRVVEAGEAAVLFTGLSPVIRGRRLLVRADGRTFGSLGDEAVDREAGTAARPLLDAEGGRVVDLEGAGAASAAAGSEVEAFAETFLPPPRIAVVGATPVAAALCRLAPALGFEVRVIDPRAAFAVPDRFPGAREVIEAWPEEGLARAGVDRWTSVVALAHDGKLDVPALAAALRAGCRYVGQIGGGRTQRLRREALAGLGLRPEETENVRGPVGLDIGAVTPEEIALAVLAEIVAVRRGKDPRRA